MLDRLYVVYDTIALEAAPVFHAKNDGVAKRQFDRMISSPNVTNPEDYRLYYVGSFDTEKMELRVATSPAEVFVTKEEYDNAAEN